MTCQMLIKRPFSAAAIALALTATIAISAIGCSALAAPSFDCTQTVDPTAKLICGNAELSDLDATLAKAYATKLNSLKESKPGSPEANEVVALQFRRQHWLAGLSYECSLARGDGITTESLIQSKTICISRVYRDRIAELALPSQQPPLSTAEPHQLSTNDVSRPSDPKHVVMVYSADDALCKPIAKLYDELNHRPVQVLDWEGDFRTRFAQIGLTSPSPWAAQSYQMRRAISGLKRIFYRLDLAGDGKFRLVYIEDLPVGSRGEYGTNVWIFNPDADVSKYLSAPVQSEGMQFDSDIVEYAIIFSQNNLQPRYKGISNPYFFDRITAPEQRSLPIRDRISGELFLGMGTINIQRVFLYNNKFIFTTRTFGFSTALVYKYVPSIGITDLCYLASEDAASRIQSYSKGR
jgi:uncharacterized protein YecT (DUF1311 family)